MMMRKSGDFPDGLPRYLGETLGKKRQGKCSGSLRTGLLACEHFIKGELTWFGFRIESDAPGFRQRREASGFGNVMYCVRRGLDRKKMKVLVVPWLNHDGSYPWISEDFLKEGPNRADCFVIAEIALSPRPEYYIVTREQANIFNDISSYLYRTGRRKEMSWAMFQGFRDMWGSLREAYGTGKPGRLESFGKAIDGRKNTCYCGAESGQTK
jgi:hypothetical protein